MVRLGHAAIGLNHKSIGMSLVSLGSNSRHKRKCRHPKSSETSDVWGSERLTDTVGKTVCNRTGSPDHESSHKLIQSDRDSKSWHRVANEGLPVLSSIFQQHLEWRTIQDLSPARFVIWHLSSLELSPSPSANFDHYRQAADAHPDEQAGLVVQFEEPYATRRRRGRLKPQLPQGW